MTSKNNDKIIQFLGADIKIRKNQAKPNTHLNFNLNFNYLSSTNPHVELGCVFLIINWKKNVISIMFMSFMTRKYYNSTLEIISTFKLSS